MNKKQHMPPKGSEPREGSGYTNRAFQESAVSYQVLTDRTRLPGQRHFRVEWEGQVMTYSFLGANIPSVLSNSESLFFFLNHLSCVPYGHKGFC